ncbi:MAG: hypothetical protein KDD42_05440 [Bdellovibrionales bacterium]|nr:hypothetical protein [Bdellovibrionales bacterium]
MSFRIQLLFVLMFSFCAIQFDAQADRLDEMVSPAGNPVTFEDPRSNTEARLIYLHHEIDNDFITQGGSATIWALQLRYAWDERLALIATKDGWVDLNPDSVLADEEGFANVAVGAKYAFYYDPQAGDIVTGGLRYEIPMGNTDVFQGRHDGFLNPFVSAATSLTDSVTFMAATGLRVPFDDAESAMWDADLHVDAKLGPIYPLVELSLIQVIDAGDKLPIADEGLDFFSFGASESSGKTVVSAGVGARARINDDLDAGLIYQFPLTNGAGSNLIDWRITADLIWSFDV